jgi:hypothetical protein
MNKHMLLVGAASTILLPGLVLSQTTTIKTFNFGATLSGAQEPMPASAPATPSLGVTTQATGTLEVKVMPDLSSLTFQLNVQNGVGVTGASLQCSPPGENGPPVVVLSASNTQGANVNGTLASGTITSKNIEAGATDCKLAGRSVRDIASLTAAMTLGLIYVNVTTVGNPTGEIRGQLIVGVTPTPAQ